MSVSWKTYIIHHPLQVVFLPECFDYVGENREQTLSMAAPLESTRMQGLRDLAKELGVWLSLGGYHEKVSLNLFFVLLVYNGGQKCWNLSSEISKTTNPSPPTPSNFKSSFGKNFVLVGGGGGLGRWRDEPKADQKTVIRSRVRCDNNLGFFSHIPTFLWPPWRFRG